jgi:hypothetical protein
MRGRTLYVPIEIGDSIGNPFPPTSPVRLPTPQPSSLIFSPVLAIHFSANSEQITAGFTLTLDDHQALSSGKCGKPDTFSGRPILS